MSANKQIMSIQEQIKAQVAAMQASHTDHNISINRKGNFVVSGVESDKDTLNVVVLAFTHNAAYWAKAWNPNQAAEAPDCAATGDLNTQYQDQAKPPMIASFYDLVPRPLEGKEAQAANCGECPMNQFMEGSGKPCKNSYTLAVLPASDPNGPIHKLRISAKGLKHFNKYMKVLSGLGLPWYAVSTTLKTEEAGQGWTTVVQSDTKLMTPLNEEQLQAFFGRLEEANRMLTFTPATGAASDEQKNFGEETISAPKRKGASA